MTLAPLFFDLDHTLWDFETNSRLAGTRVQGPWLGVNELAGLSRGFDITRRPTTVVGPNSGQAEWTKPP